MNNKPTSRNHYRIRKHHGSTKEQRVNNQPIGCLTIILNTFLVLFFATLVIFVVGVGLCG